MSRSLVIVADQLSRVTAPVIAVRKLADAVAIASYADCG
jgi:hypothetical protein